MQQFTVKVDHHLLEDPAVINTIIEGADRRRLLLVIDPSQEVPVTGKAELLLRDTLRTITTIIQDAVKQKTHRKASELYALNLLKLYVSSDDTLKDNLIIHLEHTLNDQLEGVYGPYFLTTNDLTPQVIQMRVFGRPILHPNGSLTIGNSPEYERPTFNGLINTSAEFLQQLHQYIQNKM